MKTHFHPRSRSGFTLIELLVVMSIIMVLAALSLTAISLVNKRSRELVSLTCVRDLDMALNAYRDTYNHFPSVGDQDQMTADGKAGAELLTILLGKEDPSGTMQNPKGIVFLTTKIADNKNKGGLVYSGNQVEGMFDAWGHPLNLEFDNDLDNEIADPTKPGGIVRQKNVIVWSLGADGKLGGNDEVKSW
ncbi:type II secretion system protein [Luteolibacter soli]|uniref:Type II secretion system protein n=1 Tax=Luteolibacter soli TaxID=3135280 RepID=A0ABU9ARR3_9BACT